MSTKRGTKQIINILASKVSLFILAAITVWLGVSWGQEIYRKHQVREEIEKLKAEVIAFEARNSNLASLIDSFDDPQVVELEAKKRLNLRKPGEEVAVILRDKNDESQNIVQRKDESVLIDAGEENASKPSNAMKWWRYITSN